jgi:RHS repeat-associated protein
VEQEFNPELKYLFTGQELESEISPTSFWNFRARMFNSEIGLFYAPDPAQQGYSRYGYCLGNPVSFVDPTGRYTGSGMAFWTPDMNGDENNRDEDDYEKQARNQFKALPSSAQKAVKAGTLTMNTVGGHFVTKGSQVDVGELSVYDPNTGEWKPINNSGSSGQDQTYLAWVGEDLFSTMLQGIQNMVADIGNWFGASNTSNNASWFRVYATREGLVGHKTANGHIIKNEDLFVALPSRKGLNKKVQLRYGNTILEAPVWDVGPWNTKDPYWLSGARPQSETGQDLFGRKTNKAGIDLSNAAFKDLGLKTNDWIEWRFSR